MLNHASLSSVDGWTDQTPRGLSMDLQGEEAKVNWVQALAQNELPPGERQVVKLGEHSILLIHHEGQIYALASACPHLRLPLKGAKIEGHTLTCPWHHSAFDLRTGDVEAWSPWPPAVGRMLSTLSRKKALPLYPTKVVAGAIWVGIEDE